MATHDEHAHHDELDAHDHGHDDHHHHEGPIAHVEVVPVKSFEDGMLAIVLTACFLALSVLMFSWSGIKAAPHHESEGHYTQSHTTSGHSEHAVEGGATHGADFAPTSDHEASGSPTAPESTTAPATPESTTPPATAPTAGETAPVQPAQETGH